MGRALNDRLTKIREVTESAAGQLRDGVAAAMPALAAEARRGIITGAQKGAKDLFECARRGNGQGALSGEAAIPGQGTAVPTTGEGAAP